MMDTLYYKETYVSHTPYYHTEVSGVPAGESGEPITYSVVCDGFISLGLCLCLVMSVIMAARSWRFTLFQLHNLFRTQRESSVQMRETSDEMQYQGWFILQTVLMMGLLAFSVIIPQLDDDMEISPYYILGILCGFFAIYYVVKEILYRVINMVYFGKSQRHMFNVTRTFLLAAFGALLLPVTMVHLYFDIEQKTTLVVVLFMLCMTLLLRFYRVWSIFFRKNGNLLKFFLYLCTLEFVPLALLTGVLLLTAEILKINI